jgi:hypothetical protein
MREGETITAEQIVVELMATSRSSRTGISGSGRTC